MQKHKLARRQPCHGHVFAAVACRIRVAWSPTRRIYLRLKIERCPSDRGNYAEELDLPGAETLAAPRAK